MIHICSKESILSPYKKIIIGENGVDIHATAMYNKYIEERKQEELEYQAMIDQHNSAVEILSREIQEDNYKFLLSIT